MYQQYFSHNLFYDDFGRLVFSFAFFKPYCQAFETVQLFYGMFDAVFWFPNEVEAQLAGCLVLELDLCMIVGGYPRQYLVKAHIVKNNGLLDVIL